MKKRLASAFALLALITACGGSPAQDPTPVPTTSQDEVRTGIVGQVDKAQNVADSLNQRNADLENQAP